MTPTAKELWDSKDFIITRIVQQIRHRVEVVDRFYKKEIDWRRLKELLVSIDVITERFSNRWDELNESAAIR